MENNKKAPFSKLFIRCAKDNGRYIQLQRYFNKNKNGFLSPPIFNTTLGSKQYRELEQLKSEIMNRYPRFIGQNEYMNEFSIYIVNNVIGIDYCYTLFKKFIASNYGEKVLEKYETYTKTSLMPSQQIGRFKNILKLTEENISNIVKQQQEMKYLAPLSYLYYGFDWRSTKEGFIFWQRISQEWIEHILTYIIKRYDTTTI